MNKEGQDGTEIKEGFRVGAKQSELHPPPSCHSKVTLLHNPLLFPSLHPSSLYFAVCSEQTCIFQIVCSSHFPDWNLDKALCALVNKGGQDAMQLWNSNSTQTEHWELSLQSVENVSSFLLTIYNCILTASGLPQFSGGVAEGQGGVTLASATQCFAWLHSHLALYYQIYLTFLARYTYLTM